jgi:hypothetical protein
VIPTKEQKIASKMPLVVAFRVAMQPWILASGNLEIGASKMIAAS